MCHVNVYIYKMSFYIFEASVSLSTAEVVNWNMHRLDYPAASVSFRSRSTVVSSKGNANMLENISNVFGPKQVLVENLFY